MLQTTKNEKRKKEIKDENGKEVMMHYGIKMKKRKERNVKGKEIERERDMETSY